MTEKRANEIFKTKYPEGKIVRRHASSADNKFWVIFKPEGKVYYYACSTYQELLSRFGFKIAYKHDVEALKDQVSRYKKKLSEVLEGNFDTFDFIFCERNEETEKQVIDSVRSQLEDSQKQLDYMLNECIID